MVSSVAQSHQKKSAILAVGHEFLFSFCVSQIRGKGTCAEGSSGGSLHEEVEYSYRCAFMNHVGVASHFDRGGKAEIAYKLQTIDHLPL